ncbi:MAG: hypothetical protein ABW078_12805 [Sedimenticola sp.]
MFSLRHFFDPNVKVACQRAVQHVREKHPDYFVGSARLRAEEEARYVIAVFYRDPANPKIPDPYMLFTIPKNGGTVQELECTPQSPYWIRGRK